ncbi:hypothetical protein PIB30_026456 [Stylosanthes scabra]|uniref:Uncharacterized protein n=1 Tax=Stylosanthes scabra TaxID=79078 RepID=A0ABU6VC20_9FABA|nr:hypothetical protein [Stylosanthes scabra]
MAKQSEPIAEWHVAILMSLNGVFDQAGMGWIREEGGPQCVLSTWVDFGSLAADFGESIGQPVRILLRGRGGGRAPSTVFTGLGGGSWGEGEGGGGAPRVGKSFHVGRFGQVKLNGGGV